MHRLHCVLIFFGCLSGQGLLSSLSDSSVFAQDEAATAPHEDRLLQFNKDVRSILSENCFYCHGQDAKQRQADLRLDKAEDAIDAGLIIPGNSAESELIGRILTDDPDLQMPPSGSNRHLSADEKQILREWVDQGAKYEVHWAFANPVAPPVPVNNSGWVTNPIDAFVFAKLQAHGMEPAAPANRTALIKRLYIDLLGLPPTPQQVQEFVADPDPDAYSNLVERLLSDPHYGERMALPWLDAARYADSNGFQQDGDHWQWIWRDWLVQALNDDMPFDQFTIWQLAGDLLPDATNQQRIASGFNRNHMLNGEGGAIAEEQRWVNLFDRVDTTATTWLGLTMACAQCHDHKYDPISQAEYYQFLDAFNRVPETGVPKYISSRIRVGEPFLELPTDENKKHIQELEQQQNEFQQQVDRAAGNAFQGWRITISVNGPAAENPVFASADQAIKSIIDKAEADRSDDEKKQLEDFLRQSFNKDVLPKLTSLTGIADRNRVRDELNRYRADHIPRVMIMSDDRPRETHRLDRGQYLNPQEVVKFATPQFLPPMPEAFPRNRLGLAQWLVSDQHPLTARVQVNRQWQHFFGQGLVKTSEDFGVQSQYPVHKDLLDWLAVEFRSNGWSVKHIQRLILNSATYRQSSQVSVKSAQADPENRFYGRASRFRMPAMLLRDWALSTAGLLNKQMGGPPVYPYQPKDVWESLAITKERDFTYPKSSGSDLYRRSLYTFWRRTVGPANMFDSSNRQTCRVRSSRTSTPLHALTTLNDPTWVEAARHLATQVWQETEDSDLQVEQTIDKAIEQAFWRVVCRAPREPELQQLRASYLRWHARYEAEPELAGQLLSVGESETNQEIPPSRQAALTVVCLTILNLDEALNRE